MNESRKFDIIIAGAGLAGLTAANALARLGNGLNVALVGPDISQPDGRTTALLAHSINYLEEIEVWRHARPKAAIMSVMRIIDNTKSLLHAPETTFKSIEIGLDAFGYNILNTDLVAALTSSLSAQNNYHRFFAKISSTIENDDGVSIKLDSGEELVCQLVVGADGRNSTIRKQANGGKGIGVHEWSYPQTAIVLNFSHSLPHHDTSTEFHNICGPFTIVPLKESVSSLVWVVRPGTAEQLTLRDSQSLNREIENQMHSVLGKTRIITPIQTFPLSGMKVREMAAGRFVLVGESGHVFPPIGAQGYNLGIRDIEEMTHLAAAGIRKPEIFASQYNARRQGDVISRTMSVDLLNRSLLSEFLPLRALRSGAIMAIGNIAPLRKFMMREGVSPGMGLRALSSRIGRWPASNWP